MLRLLSSVGSEHLVYTEGVTGSSPVGATMKKFIFRLLLLVLILLPFKDAESKQTNRCYKRYNGTQIEELILTLNHLQKPIK